MLFSTLLLTSPFVEAVSAFTIYDELWVKNWIEKDHLTKACGKVLLTNIDCDSDLDGMGTTGWQGLLEDDQNLTRTDGICAKKCGDSLMKWVEALNKDCAEEDFKEGDIMIEGRKQLCDKDTKTGKYCNEIIEEFPYIGDDVDEELPLKYLCEPCYVRRIWSLDISHYSPANGWIEDQRERMDKECPKSVLAEKPATAAADKTLTTTATSSEFSKVPTTVQSGDETITTAETTPTSTTTSAEVTDSPKDSLGGKVESGKAGNYWGFVLVLGLNVFRL